MADPMCGMCSERGPHGGPRPLRMSRRGFLVTTAWTVASLAACTAPLPGPSLGPAPSPLGDQDGTRPSGTPQVTLSRTGACARSLPTVVPPTPIPYPGHDQAEPTTGLHVIGQPQPVDLSSYRLKVSGLVGQAVSLSYDDLRCLPKVGARVTLECPGFFVDSTNLAGATLASVIALAGAQRAAALATLTGLDGHTTYVSLPEAQAQQNFLAYEWEGEPLPASHGFPLRAVFPRRPGSDWVKWLAEIKLS